jgi:hypothetical protein
MLLQELFKPENAHLKEVSGIELDADSAKTEYSTPPENIESIGFVFKVDSDNMIDEGLLDIIISYKLTNLSVLIEVPSHIFKQGIEPKYLLQLASNVDFAVSLLPPGHALVDASYTTEEYTDLIKRFTDELLSRQNFDKAVVPITNFFQYVMMEKLLGKEGMGNFKVEDPYIIENFASILSVENSDKFKKEIREKLYAFYGSEEEFDEVAKLMFDTLYNKAKNVFTDQVKQYVQQNPAA